MATIKDVASKAGVSISTVSLVINGKRNISTEKYHAILAAMKELNYRPSIIAQNLKKQKFHIIGVVLPSTDGHYSQILKGIHSVLSEKKYHIIVSLTGDDIQKEEDIFEEFISMGASGVISVPCDTENVEKYKKWIETGLSIVFIERRLEDVDFSNVIYDNQKIIYNKTKELLEQYKPEEMALITGSLKHSNESECVLAFRDAVSEAYPEAELEKLEIAETSLKRTRKMYDLLKRYGQDECHTKCYLLTDIESAEMLAEIQVLMKRKPSIYALSGDVWLNSKKQKAMVKLLPRESNKLGQKSAELLMRFVKNNRVTEKRDVLVETNYDYRETKDIKTVQIKNAAPLKVLLLQSNAMDVLFKLAPNFTKETGIKTQFTFVPFYKLTHMLAGDPDKVPDHDVLWVDVPLVDTMSRMGRLLDLRPWLDSDERNILDRFPSGVLKCVSNKKQQIYGLPLLMDEGLLYYRKDVFNDPAVQWSFFNKYGFELKPPISWTEFNYIAEFFDPAVNKKSKFKSGTVLSLTGPTAILEEFYVRQWAFNGRMVDKWGKLSINSIENVRALENLITSYKHSPPDSLDYFFEETFACLLKGETPMVQGFPTHYQPFRYAESKDSLEAQIDVAPLPGGKPLLGGWVMGVNSATKMQTEAFEFLNWVLREDMVVAKGMLGHLVPVKATYESTILNNYYPGLKMMNIDNFSKELREVIKDNKGNIIDQFQFEEVVSEELIKALRSQQSAEEALKKAQEKVGELLFK